MADYQLSYSGADIDSALGKILNNAATAGQALVSDGSGGTQFADVGAASVNPSAALGVAYVVGSGNQTVYSITGTAGKFLGWNGGPAYAYPGELTFLTTAPVADNNNGTIKIVVLSSEPATRYNGYLYIITA